jgi:ABC-type bacteriocin/lantibiotic exporter with double-glycine peptidase domain
MHHDHPVLGVVIAALLAVVSIPVPALALGFSLLAVVLSASALYQVRRAVEDLGEITKAQTAEVIEVVHRVGEIEGPPPDRE